MRPDEVDDRITLPLSAVRRAVAESCKAFDCSPDDHASWCLGPLLQARDDLIAKDFAATGPSPDCQVGKHEACSGCPCDCHRHSARRP